MKYETREEWLTQAVTELGPLFTDRGKPLPNKVRVACGWPSNRGTSSRNKVVGQCWHSEATKDWAKEKGDNFLIIRFKSIIDGGDKSMPLESFFEHYDLLTQKFDDTKWIN
jgi:hypothetical protein